MTLLLAVVAIVLSLPASWAQSEPSFTINPVMTKGAAAAPVTIVEFSDYE